ncbi:interferon alpha/beta receptor 1 isoform X2 [Oxyura jamaicensis]|uniref:interferon alpha/beta receptor 1 isoform X2 n=1 Tax=Oxyura jamaicensis TaxID=8884 RepID=UPI0015A5AEFE|nr:interferon alpha/beta receptor 1 isoform X2 [Oxyura jamaicensis]
MEAAGRRALALLLPLWCCLLASAPRRCAGQTDLKSPQDIEVYVVNTNFTLRWNYTGNDTNVTFSAEYQWFGDLKTSEAEWKELPGCQNVTDTECDFSSAITEYYDKHLVRVRAERKEDKSPWSSVFEMIPYFIAQIGAPEINLQSINGVIKIQVSPPEANQVRKMWISQLSFKYNLVIWENSSDAEVRSQSIFPTDTISGLAPETTYCLKVQATLPLYSQEGLFSPTHCVKTTRKVNDLFCPANLKVFALNMKFHLHWNNPYKQHVSYTVQYLIGYLKKLHDDYSVKWLNVPRCENITNTECNFTSIITITSGFYYLRVQAMNQYNKSCLSNEVIIDPLRINEIGPPAVKVDISDVLLHVQISPPGGPEDKIMTEHYYLSYQIVYWKNSSDNEEEVKEIKQTIATISDLTPSTQYCVKVKAFSEAYNKSSPFSKEECIKTPGEGFGEELFGSPYLPTAEEPIESCYVIESILEEVNQTDFKDYKHSKQSSRDSGNYSNDDDTSGSKGSDGMLEKEII